MPTTLFPDRIVIVMMNSGHIKIKFKKKKKKRAERDSLTHLSPISVSRFSTCLVRGVSIAPWLSSSEIISVRR